MMVISIIVIFSSGIYFIPYNINSGSNPSSSSGPGSNPVYMNITMTTLHDGVIAPETKGATFTELSLIHSTNNSMVNITAATGNLTALNMWSNTLGFSALKTVTSGVTNIITTITEIVSGNITIDDAALEPTYFHVSYQNLTDSNIVINNI